MAKSGWMKPIDFYSLKMMFVILASSVPVLYSCVFVVGAVLFSELVGILDLDSGSLLFSVSCFSCCCHELSFSAKLSSETISSRL